MEGFVAAGPVLEEAEALLVGRVVERLSLQGAGRSLEGLVHLHRGVERLAKLWGAMESYPSVLSGETLGDRRRDLRSLIDTLAAANPYSVEVFLPTRAALCRAFLQAKLNFCRMTRIIVAEMLGTDEAAGPLDKEAERLQTGAVCSIIAEDLLRMIACDETIAVELRRRATAMLVQMWERRPCRAVPRFFPALASVWEAKSRVEIAYGTLTGAAELLSLLSQGSDPVFIECFSRDGGTEDEKLALQEFVFNASYEQLRQVESAIERGGTAAVGPGEVARILGVPLSRLHVTTCSCEDMIYTFRERQTLAGHRRALGYPGPKRTAEQYLMTYLLERTSDEAIDSCSD